MKELINKHQYLAVQRKSLMVAERVNDLVTNFQKDLDEVMKYNDEVSMGECNAFYKIFESIGVDFEGITSSEKQIISATPLSQLLSKLRGVANKFNNMKFALTRLEENIDDVRQSDIPEMPVDRREEMDVLDVVAIRKRVTQNMKDVRAKLNAGYGDEYVVAKTITLKYTTDRGYENTKGTSTSPDYRDAVNNAIRKGYVNVIAYCNYRDKGTKVETNCLYSHSPIVVWTNPDETVHARLAFNKL